MTLPAWSAPAALGLATAVVTGWNLAHGARATTLPDAGRAFRALTGLCAFLFLPAILIGLLAPTAPGARILSPLSWLPTLVAAGVLTQALWALRRGRAPLPVWLPIVALDLLVAWVTAARWLEGLGAALPAWVLAPGMAVSMVAAAWIGDVAFVWAAALLVPAVAPSAPARWRLSRVARGGVATFAAVVVAAAGARLPRAYEDLSAAGALGRETGASRTRSDLAIGLRLFGPLDGAPSATVARHDLTVADSLGVTAVHIELTPEGVTAGVLDSVARSLELRRDSVVLVVTLDLPRDGSLDAGVVRARLALIARIIRRLRPTVLVPAERVASGPGAPDTTWWQAYYDSVAATTRRGGRGVSVALGTDAGAPADSVLVDWVLRGASPLHTIALSVRRQSGTPGRFGDALAATARWVSLARIAPAVWITTVPTAPATTGEVVQRQLVRHALAWGAAHTFVRGVIAGDASDVMSPTGLRTATGRSRPALHEVGSALRALRDIAPAPGTADSLAVDSLRPAPNPPPPALP